MTIATNEQALAADILDLVFRIKKAGDETVNNNNTLQNDDDLIVPVSANEIWVVRFYLRILQGASAAPNFKYAVVVPAAAVVSYVSYYGDDNDTNRAVTACGSSSAVAITVIAGASERTFLVIDCIVTNGGNAGNIQLQWAQANATGVDTIVEEESCLIAHRIF